MDSDVTVTFNCGDKTSGVATCPEPVTLTGEGAGQQAEGVVADEAGRTAKARVEGINIDKSDPSITSSLSTAPDAAGWHRRAVTVSFACSEAISKVGSCPEPVVVEQGAAQKIGGIATDNAGRTASTRAGRQR